MKDKDKRIYDVDVQEFVAEADVDGDGSVNYEEFVNMIFRGVGIIIEYRRLRMKEKRYFMSISHFVPRVLVPLGGNAGEWKPILEKSFL